MGSPKQSTQTTTSRSQNSGETWGNTGTTGLTTDFSRQGTGGPAGDVLMNYLSRAQMLSNQGFNPATSPFQAQTFAEAPAFQEAAKRGLNVTDAMAQGTFQNDRLNADIQRQLALGEGTYLSGILGDRSGLSNSGVRQDLANRQNQYIQDRLSDEYRFNTGLQQQAAQALPGMAGQLSNYTMGLGDRQRGLEAERLGAPLQNLGVLGQALQLGGARYGTETAGNRMSDVNVDSYGRSMSQSEGEGTQPGPYQPSMLGQLLGLAGTAAGAYFGGPAGATAGKGIADFLGNIFGGDSPSTYGSTGAPQLYNPNAARGGMLLSGNVMPW